MSYYGIATAVYTASASAESATSPVYLDAPLAHNEFATSHVPVHALHVSVDGINGHQVPVHSPSATSTTVTDLYLWYNDDNEWDNANNDDNEWDTKIQDDYSRCVFQLDIFQLRGDDKVIFHNQASPTWTFLTNDDDFVHDDLFSYTASHPDASIEFPSNPSADAIPHAAAPDSASLLATTDSTATASDVSDTAPASDALTMDPSLPILHAHVLASAIIMLAVAPLLLIAAPVPAERPPPEPPPSASSRPRFPSPYWCFLLCSTPIPVLISHSG